MMMAVGSRTLQQTTTTPAVHTAGGRTGPASRALLLLEVLLTTCIVLHRKEPLPAQEEEKAGRGWQIRCRLCCCAEDGPLHSVDASTTCVPLRF